MNYANLKFPKFRSTFPTKMSAVGFVIKHNNYYNYDNAPASKILFYYQYCV